MPLDTQEDYERLGVHLAVIDAPLAGPSQPRTAIQSILRYLADAIPTDASRRKERFFAAFTSRWPIRQPAVPTVSFPRFHTPSSAGLGLTTTSNTSDGIVLSFIPERFHSRRSLARYCFISTTFTTTSRLSQQSTSTPVVVLRRSPCYRPHGIHDGHHSQTNGKAQSGHRED